MATSALELGIDIGALDVAVLAGYPGTMAATWQRAGRAGRRAGQSAAVLVASSAPLDQYVVRNPSYFFGASPEHALINPDNLQILLAHIKCAAFELPFGTDRGVRAREVPESPGARGGGPPSPRRGAGARRRGALALDIGPTRQTPPAYAAHRRTTSWWWTAPTHTRGIGEADLTSALSVIYPKAIYMVEGAPFQVEGLHFEDRKAFVRQVDCDYYTDAIRYDRVTILDTSKSIPESKKKKKKKKCGSAGRSGPVVARRSPRRLARRRLQEDQVVHERECRLRRTGPARAGDAHDRLLADHPAAGDDGPALRRRRPAGRRDRPGVRRAPGGAAAPDVRPARRRRVDRERHGAGRAAGGGGERDGVRPIGGRRSTGRPRSHRQPGAGGLRRAAIFVYDNYPGGIGLSEPLFTMRQALLAKTRDLIASCPCESGCPSCVGPLGEVGPLAKTVALDILSAII